MPNEIYVQCEREIRRRYEDAHLKIAKRKEQLYPQYPILQELENKIKNTSMSIVAVTFAKEEGYQQQVQRIIQTNQLDQQQIKHILVQIGLDENYLEIQYVCNKCSDSGFVLGKRCECFENLIKQKKIQKCNEKSNLNKNFKFETFSVDYYQNPDDIARMTDIYNNCVEYACSFKVNSKNIIMTGETGLGKTHLSESIANLIVENGFEIFRINSTELFRNLNAEYFKKVDNGTSLIDKIRDVDLFILDDLGAEIDSIVVIPMLYNIIDTRLNMQKPTIITTNLTIEKIEQKYKDKIASRLISYNWLKFAGRDIRQIKGNQ